jgi:hypothetical protein
LELLADIVAVAQTTLLVAVAVLLEQEETVQAQLLEQADLDTQAQ